jgi:hypothetical protein
MQIGRTVWCDVWYDVIYKTCIKVFLSFHVHASCPHLYAYLQILWLNGKPAIRAFASIAPHNSNFAKRRKN